MKNSRTQGSSFFLAFVFFQCVYQSQTLFAQVRTLKIQLPFVNTIFSPTFGKRETAKSDLENPIKSTNWLVTLLPSPSTRQAHHYLSKRKVMLNIFSESLVFWELIISSVKNENPYIYVIIIFKFISKMPLINKL